jgi:hypothetical protein
MSNGVRHVIKVLRKSEAQFPKELLKLKQKQTTLVLCQKEMHGQLILELLDRYADIKYNCSVQNHKVVQLIMLCD